MNAAPSRRSRALAVLHRNVTPSFLVYLSLAGLVLFAGFISVSSLDSAVDDYEALVEANEEVANRLDALSDLGVQLRRMNEAGNSLFSSEDPAGEQERLRQARERFRRGVGEVQALFKRQRVEDIPSLHRDLEAMQPYVDAMSEESERIFLLLQQDQIGPATESMVRMERAFSAAYEQIKHIREELSRRELQDNQRSLLRQREMRRDQNVAIGLMFVLIVALMAYGYRLLRRQRTEEARQLHLVEQQQSAELARREAIEASRLKTQFLANMSHEIRTPLNGILGTLELALSARREKEVREYLDVMRSSAELLHQIVNDILDISRIEAQRMTLEQVPFDLHSLLRSTLKASTARAASRGVFLSLELGEDVPRRLRGDPTRLRQILLNLLGNALKFTEKGSVSLRAAVRSGESSRPIIQFSVEDTGVGIPAEKLGRIFEPFTQADESTTRRFGGSGLGLAICRELVGLMGGELWVESEPGVGSTFHFTVVMDLASEAQVPMEPVLPDRLRSLPVMVLAGAGGDGELCAHMLAALELNPMLSHDPADALETLRVTAEGGFPIPLLLVEDELPQLDVRALGQKLQTDPLLARTGLVVISRRHEERSASGEVAAGIRGHLTPPVSNAALLETIQAALTRSLQPQQPLHTPVPEGVRAMRVLLAEDNPTNQLVARRLLEKAGHKVVSVENGRLAVDAVAQQGPFDVVLMDVQMPEMDGYEATAALRSTPQGAHLPIVALTAHAMTGDREKCLAAGMNDYLSKPLRADRLQALLAELAGRPLAGEAGAGQARSSDSLAVN